MLHKEIKVLLVCNAGMSTGIMQVKLEEEAKKKILKPKFWQYPYQK